MTNGEKIVNTFHGKVSKTDGVVYFSTGGWIHAYDDEWWNSEYKEPTKNDSEIDMAIKIIKADDLAPYSVEDILKARDLTVEALKQMKTAKKSLSAEEVTALAEWTEKLTKASEDAYNKGYADGMNDQELILDKIRAEIEQHRYGLVNDGLDIALNIIDKYKAESE